MLRIRAGRAARLAVRSGDESAGVAEEVQV